jgi:uncharacterized protein (TIGR00251 family)
LGPPESRVRKDPAYSSIHDTPRGVEFDVRVIPRARKSEIAGIRDDAVVVRLAAPPVDGAANEALVAFVAEWLAVPRRAVRIRSGERSRRKRLAVDGVSVDLVRARLDR